MILEVTTFSAMYVYKGVDRGLGKLKPPPPQTLVLKLWFTCMHYRNNSSVSLSGNLTIVSPLNLKKLSTPLQLM